MQRALARLHRVRNVTVTKHLQGFEGAQVSGSTQTKTFIQQGFEGAQVPGSTKFANDKQIAQLAYTFTTATRVSDEVRAWNALLLQAFAAVGVRVLAYQALGRNPDFTPTASKGCAHYAHPSAQCSAIGQARATP